MVHSSAARLAWRLFSLSLIAITAIGGSTSIGGIADAADARARPTQVSAGALQLFLDGLESGDDCRWSSAVPPEPGSCSDSLPNGCETDVDCGGRTCPGCGFGASCLQASDCLSGICYLGLCDTSYQLTVTSSGGGAVNSTPAGIDCGVTCSALFDAGTVVTLEATPDADALFLGWSGACSGTGACVVTLDQTTSVTAHFGHTLTVSRNGTGAVTSTPAGIDCGATCAGVFEHGTAVTLAARTTNGSGSYFSGWAGDCASAGAFHDCTLSVTAARSVNANFLPQTWNLAFVSSTTFAANLGSAAAYDTECNLLASAAGINNAPGTAFMAWISSTASSAGARLGSPRGWVRLDGAPFADTKTKLLDNRQIFRAIDLDENGTRRTSQSVMTGTNPDGTATTSATCYRLERQRTCRLRRHRRRAGGVEQPQLPELLDVTPDLLPDENPDRRPDARRRPGQEDLALEQRFLPQRHDDTGPGLRRRSVRCARAHRAHGGRGVERSHRRRHLRPRRRPDCRYRRGAHHRRRTP